MTTLTTVTYQSLHVPVDFPLGRGPVKVAAAAFPHKTLAWNSFLASGTAAVAFGLSYEYPHMRMTLT